MKTIKDFIKNLRFTWKYAKSEKKLLILNIFSYIIWISISIIMPIISAKIIVSLTNNDLEKILYFGIVIFIIQFIDYFFNYVLKISNLKIYRNILAKLEIDLSKNILKIENKCLDYNGSGVFIQRITNDTTYLAEIFNSLLEQISGIIQYLGIIIAILIINRLIFIYAIFMITILFLIERIRTNKKTTDDKEYRKSNEKLFGFISELVRGARDIKMLNSENDFTNELTSIINTSKNKYQLMQKRSWTYQFFSHISINIFEFILIILLIVFLKKNLLEATTALVIYNYFTRLEWSSWIAGDFLEYIKSFNLSTERIIAILEDNEFKKEKFGTKHIDNIKGNFEFKNVSFSYDKNKVLKNLSFKINANETVAFVGKSGAGKTTIFNLLCKMYDINSGKITIDGININELDKDSIRGNITIISQNPYIFNMSIKDNLRLVKSNVTNKEIKEACKIACLDEFINTLPDKYDSIIGEGGVNLSGGQKQRLAIARALIQKTKIILFDEATSALDNETQEKIQIAIENMRNDYTILIIAHRLSTIINADHILFLNNGKIEATGTHKELLKTSSAYKKLYESELSKHN